MIPTLSQVCTLSTPFADDIAEYGSAGCHHIEIWMTKLEQALQHMTAAAVKELCDRHAVSVPVGSYQGGLFQPESAGFRETWIAYERRLECCAALGMQTLVVAGDVREDLSAELIDRVQARLTRVATAAEAHRIQIAFEFQAKATFANNLQTAVALIEKINHPALGICLDMFHFSVGPSKLQDLELLSSHTLRHVQLCDLADVPREIATDRDRILPGEGDLPLARVMARLHEIDYAGTVSLELMNPRIWQIPARQFGEVGMAALRRWISP